MSSSAVFLHKKINSNFADYASIVHLNQCICLPKKTQKHPNKNIVSTLTYLSDRESNAPK